MTACVILSDVEDRGYGRAALRSWLQQRGVAVPWRLVVACQDPATPARWGWEGLARPVDRLLVHPGAPMNALLNAAAREADGDWLLVTECHVLAHPGTLAAALARGKAGQRVLAIGSRSFASRSRLARGQAALFAWNTENAQRFTPWHRFWIRGTLLPRGAWEAVGGLAEDYGHFAEVHLGMKLAEHGLQPDTLPGEWLTHVELETLQELEAANRLYGLHERLARAREPELVGRFLPRVTLSRPASSWLTGAWRLALARLPLSQPVYDKLLVSFARLTAR
ncbi:MAG: hypothetical protein VKQ33_13085 [Candidatus Sericytochromatia bacterium]|nr:hypothetical protein [Candidatus Sericytochromatia bacterium]